MNINKRSKMRKILNNRFLGMVVIIGIFIFTICTYWLVGNYYRVDALKGKLDTLLDNRNFAILKMNDLVTFEWDTVTIDSPFPGYRFSPLVIHFLKYNSSKSVLDYIPFLSSTTIVMPLSFTTPGDPDLYDIDNGANDNDPIRKSFDKNDIFIVSVLTNTNYSIECMNHHAHHLLQILKDNLTENELIISSGDIVLFQWDKLIIKPYELKGYHGVEFTFESSASLGYSFLLPKSLVKIVEINNKVELIATPDSRLIFKKSEGSNSWYNISTLQ